ncbi:MAG: ferrochelatase [Thermodesulfobacteriota bacterium]|nr:ferrochelatase [Thermodesulfobacteriota bacterium]
MQQSEKTKKIGVLLLNLGGPEKPEDVRPFLYNLFSDRQIIQLGPSFLQKPIAALIARRRAPKSIANYRKIGGGSPITRITGNQAEALARSLAGDGDFMVRPCMRYWSPFAGPVIREMIQAGVTQLICLPLYPHYSKATSGSSFYDIELQNRKNGFQLPVREIRSWPTEEKYISCLASRISEGTAIFDEPVQIVYSAHSLPKKFIDEGDPYVDELKQTIAAVEQQTGKKGKLCYQSRSGPVEWLEPSTPDMLKQLAGQGCTNILMVPISFVSDHIETLYEIDMLYKEQAKDVGMRLKSTRGLNDDPQFIAALRNLVLSAL